MYFQGNVGGPPGDFSFLRLLLAICVGTFIGMLNVSLLMALLVSGTRRTSGDLHVFTSFLSMVNIQKPWKLTNVQLVPKKGNHSNPENYRPIMLFSSYKGDGKNHQILIDELS